jgi:hypothetical protein
MTIPSARVPITINNLISREWYRFLFELFKFVNEPTAPVIQDPAILSYSLSVGTVEIGSTVTTVVATWAFNKAMESATLTDTTITPDETGHTFSGLNLTTNKSYTLSCTDAEGASASAIRTVSFSHKRYWGVSSETSLDSSEIIALSSEFSTSKVKSVTYNCTGGKYPYFCYLASAGALTNVTVGGLAFSDYTETVQNFTNASGNTSSFRVVKFNNLQNGSNIVVSWS